MSKTVIWIRRPKSGRRAPMQIPVNVVERTPSGAFVIERYRGFRLVRETLAEKNIRPLVEFAVVGP